MKFSLSDLKMRTKLLLLASIGILGLVVIGTLSTLDLKQANRDLAQINSSIQTVTNFGEMKSRLLMARLNLVYMMALTDMTRISEKFDDYNKQISEIRNLIKQVEQQELDQEEKDLLATFKAGVEAYAVQGSKLAEMLLAAHRTQDQAALSAAVSFGSEKVAPLYNKPAESINTLNAFNIKHSQEHFRIADESSKKQIFINTLIILCAIALSIIVCIVIARGITRSLANVFDTMSAIAGGDLTARSSITSADEMGMLGKEMNLMGEKLSGIIRKLSDNSLSVSSAAVQMHSTSAQMATSTEELAAQASTIATACEEMSATSSEIARNCHSAADDSAKANDAARMGAQVVEETVNVMSRIADRVRSTAKTVETLGSRSDQIGQIIGTIEDIADQTNLLALNAAIEAARAGEQGRGFAVVADEVRALAERTTRATREIGEMIKSIQSETRSAVSAMDEGVRQVEQGTLEAGKSGEALRHILEQIANVTNQVNQIAVAAEEQTATTTEINNNIQQITEVAHISSVASHEEASAANQLSNLAEDLKRMVELFKYA
ncbi:MAG: chemotaxis protein [Geobacteraceae bacterium GWC2_55_20]|nr:MAG: chemotaxis protein [Geobacteraceae bacterium GWC2_55_20]OGU25506.1 MAG: chemotaxis protein [Geobacteraceae bacterium GWF2_54_21]HBA72129.1 methyl-accepting chemotaxis protein [Geobacter sp.]HCE68079.1 methyl-accepting chemotaxis protein [Geobacter sp.]